MEDEEEEEEEDGEEVGETNDDAVLVGSIELVVATAVIWEPNTWPHVKVVVFSHVLYSVARSEWRRNMSNSHDCWIEGVGKRVNIDVVDDDENDDDDEDISPAFTSSSSVVVFFFVFRETELQNAQYASTKTYW